MAASAKKTRQFARELFKLSFVDGVIAPDRVAGVLEYVEKQKISHPVRVLKAYARLVAAEEAKSAAVVEHAGSVNEATLAAIAATMSRKYARAIRPLEKTNAALIAGLRVQVGDDVYESSISSQLAALAAAV